MKNISIIAIYSRNSKLTGRGQSTVNQVKLCKEYAYNYFKVSQMIIYEDQGYSGRNVERPKFKEMIEDSRKRKFDVLICYHIDRISRNIADFSSLIENLQENRIDFVSIKQQFDTSTPMGRAMMYISSVFAQLERETIAERIKDNMYELARTGRWLGGNTPTGYTSKPECYVDEEGLTKKMYILSPVEHELKLVSILYNKYLELDSLTQLESWTLESNIKTKFNKNFNSSTLRIILSNPVYAIADKQLHKYFDMHKSDIASNIEEFDGIHGLMVFNKHDEKAKRVTRKDKSSWIVTIGKHRGIIPSKEWIKVQQQLEKNSKKARRSGTSKVGLLTPILYCKNCRSKMRIICSRKNNNTYHYYKCILKEKSRSSKCNIKNLNGNLAEKFVLDELQKINCKTIKIYNDLNVTCNRLLSLLKSSNFYKENLQNELEEIGTFAMESSKHINSKTSRYIVTMFDELEKEINYTKAKLKNLQSSNITSNCQIEQTDKILSILKSLYDNICALKFKNAKKIIHEIIDKIYWDGEKMEITICQEYKNI